MYLRVFWLLLVCAAGCAPDAVYIQWFDNKLAHANSITNFGVAPTPLTLESVHVDQAKGFHIMIDNFLRRMPQKVLSARSANRVNGHRVEVRDAIEGTAVRYEVRV